MQLFFCLFFWQGGSYYISLQVHRWQSNLMIAQSEQTQSKQKSKAHQNQGHAACRDSSQAESVSKENSLLVFWENNKARPHSPSFQQAGLADITSETLVVVHSWDLQFITVTKGEQYDNPHVGGGSGHKRGVRIPVQDQTSIQVRATNTHVMPRVIIQLHRKIALSKGFLGVYKQISPLIKTRPAVSRES